jgi:DNA-binding response OmpR family regulator
MASKSLSHFGAAAAELIVLTQAELEAFAEGVIAKTRVEKDPRTPANLDVGAIIVTGPLTVSVEAYEAHIEGRRLPLKPREFALLNVLAQNTGKVLHRRRLLELVWPNCESLESDRTLDVHIRRLRLKLGRNAGLIETIRGVGYKLVKVSPVNGDGA